jgi:hypothetical protein
MTRAARFSTLVFSSIHSARATRNSIILELLTAKSLQQILEGMGKMEYRELSGLHSLFSRAAHGS